MTDSSDMHIPLLDETDIAILMHRDAHFSKSFDLMLEYYREEGVGYREEFSLKRIQQLAAYEKSSKDDLSDLLLPESAKAEIEDAKKMYLDLRKVYEDPKSSSMAQAISDLILTEDEEAEEEIAKVVSFGTSISCMLIDLLKTDKLYNPVFPGYGRAPLHAAKALALLEDERAIAPLYQMIGSADFEMDESLIMALCTFKHKTRDFLLKRLTHEPLSKENEHAAIVLTAMPEDEVVAKECLKLLGHPLIHKHSSLANYLLLACSALSSQEDRKLFEQRILKIPNIMKHEAEIIISNWNKNTK